LQVPEGTPGVYRDIMNSCWCDEPMSRPEFRAIAAIFVSKEKQIMQEESANKTLPKGQISLNSGQTFEANRSGQGLRRTDAYSNTEVQGRGLPY